MVGSDKGNRAHVEQTAKHLGLAEQVSFPGFVSSNELVELYQNALALVFPTFFGPDNLPPLEAFGLGCPVIASNVSGAVEQLGDAALLFDPDDEVALAQAILELRGDAELRATLIARGRLRAEERSIAYYLQRMLGLFDAFEKKRRCWAPGVVKS